MLYGLSVGQCFKDMAKGRVDINDVAMVIGGTKIQNSRDLEHVCKTYRDLAWKDCPEAEALFRSFYWQGRVWQPRVYGKLPPHSDPPWTEKLMARCRECGYVGEAVDKCHACGSLEIRLTASEE